MTDVLHPDPVVDLSEQPTDAAMSRLSAALDAALSPPPPGALRGPTIGPDRAGTHHCLRCGYSWTPRLSNSSPKNCASCKSAFWDRPPLLPTAARPEDTDWDAVRAKAKAQSSANERRRRIKRLVAAAKELDLTVIDPLTTEPLRPPAKPRSTRRRTVLRDVFDRVPTAEELTARIATLEERLQTRTPIAPAAPAPAPDIHAALDAEWRGRGRTVPPPPGLEEGQ